MLFAIGLDPSVLLTRREDGLTIVTVMADYSQLAPPPTAGPSRISAKDIEGVGKFKVSNS